MCVKGFGHLKSKGDERLHLSDVLSIAFHQRREHVLSWKLWLKKCSLLTCSWSHHTFSYGSKASPVWPDPTVVCCLYFPFLILLLEVNCELSEMHCALRIWIYSIFTNFYVKSYLLLDNIFIFVSCTCPEDRLDVHNSSMYIFLPRFWPWQHLNAVLV